MRTFRCLTYTCILLANITKFSPKAKSFIFVSYPPNMKAYKLYDIATNEIFISGDVIFHETIFLFQNSSHKIVEDPFEPLVLPVPIDGKFPSDT